MVAKDFKFSVPDLRRLCLGGSGGVLCRLMNGSAWSNDRTGGGGGGFVRAVGASKKRTPLSFFSIESDPPEKDRKAAP